MFARSYSDAGGRTTIPQTTPISSSVMTLRGGDSTARRPKASTAPKIFNYYPPRGDNKEGWDNVDLFGWLGYPSSSKSTSYAAIRSHWPLDLCLFRDLAQRAGLGGIQEWLSFYFKSPRVAPGPTPNTTCSSSKPSSRTLCAA